MKCIFCNWEYDNGTYHQCNCGKENNLSESKGVCTECFTAWDYAQCPKCGEMGLMVMEGLQIKSDLFQLLEEVSFDIMDEEIDLQYEKSQLSEPPSYSECELLLCNKTIGEEDILNVRLHIIRKAQKWLSSKEDYFQYCPNARDCYNEILEEDAEYETIIDYGMNQISNNTGFDLETPLRNLHVSGFYGLIDILRLDNIQRTTDYSTIKLGYVVDRFELSGNTGNIVMYNRVEYSDAKTKE